MTDLMVQESVSTTDLEQFAAALGLDGLDFDLFYETYYSIDTWEWEYEVNED